MKEELIILLVSQGLELPHEDDISFVSLQDLADEVSLLSIGRFLFLYCTMYLSITSLCVDFNVSNIISLVLLVELISRELILSRCLLFRNEFNISPPQHSQLFQGRPMPDKPKPPTVEMFLLQNVMARRIQNSWIQHQLDARERLQEMEQMEQISRFVFVLVAETFIIRPVLLFYGASSFVSAHIINRHCTT